MVLTYRLCIKPFTFTSFIRLEYLIFVKQLTIHGNPFFSSGAYNIGIISNDLYNTLYLFHYLY